MRTFLPVLPARFRRLALDAGVLQAALSDAPTTDPSLQQPAVIEVPMPDGTMQRFSFAENSIMHPALAGRYPGIRTFRGVGIDDPTAWVRFEWLASGFRAMARTSGGMVFIDPYELGNPLEFISYYRSDYDGGPDAGLVEGAPIEIPELAGRKLQTLGAKSFGAALRTYRLAVATTGEYSSFHDASSPAPAAEDSLGAVVSAINRVAGLYEVDVAASFQLVANNDQLIYTNAATDPYNNDDAFQLLSQNQSNTDSVIGSANYDIGHVFSTGGGGLAGLGVVCSSGNKARGETGAGQPINDPFWVDYVAHEIGHQMGANHTFNGNAGACNGNRAASRAYEPGSGTTIMAYAGICGVQDVQTQSDTAGGASDPYFHGASVDEMIAVRNATSCGSDSPTGNGLPQATARDGGFSIPAQTPFALTGTASDANGSGSLTYTWEQFDLGPAGVPSPERLGPLFRSRTGTAQSTRYLPQLPDILSGANGNPWEVLPSISRDLNFRMTVRDGASGGGGIDWDTLSFSVDASSGPFLVTAPAAGESARPGDSLAVSWNVAGTDAGSVNCPLVNIRLSTNAGESFGALLASGTANDGSHTVTVPAAETTEAYVMVECASNIFLDVSGAFAITDSEVVELASDDVPKPIASNGTPVVTSTLTVASGLTIQDLNVTGLLGTHTYISDLRFTLTSPSGTSVVIVAPVCGSQDNFDLNLDDEAEQPVASAPCPPTGGGSFQPSNPLSVFDGENAQGTWTLTVEDLADQDGGSLNGWGLRFTGLSSDVSCSGDSPLVSDRNFLSGESVVCSGTTSVSTEGSVIVSSGATVRFVGPAVRLRPGFVVQTGGSFRAGPP